MPRNVTLSFFFSPFFLQCWKQRESQAVSSGSGLRGNLGGCEGHNCLYSHGTAQCAMWNRVGSSEHLWAGWALLPPSWSLSWLLPAHPPGRAGQEPAHSRPPISSAAHPSLPAAGSPLGHPALPGRSRVHIPSESFPPSLPSLWDRVLPLLPHPRWDKDQFVHSVSHSTLWERAARGGSPW